MSRFISRAGFVVLVLIVLFLFGCSLVETFNHHPWLTVVKVVIVTGLVYEIARERKSLAEARFKILDWTNLWNFTAVVAGALITYSINVRLGCGAVIASGVAGLCGAVVLRRYAVPFFCGSFVGMASPYIFISLTCIMSAGIIAGVIFFISTPVLNGFGGKLGNIAFGGCLGASLLLRTPLESTIVPGWDIGGIIIIYSIIGAVVTFSVSIRLKAGPVAASALMGIFAGLVLPLIHGRVVGNTLAIMVFCASFVGMSSVARIPNEMLMAVAGLFSGLVFMYTSPYLGGAGGKLGSIAFGSAIAARGIIELFVLIIRTRRKERTGKE